MALKVEYDANQLRNVCHQFNIRKLAIFGSAVRDDFTDQSDIDIVIDFFHGMTPSLFTFVDLIEELSIVFGGRRIDLVTYPSLNKRLRDDILSEAEVQYDQAI